MPLDAVCLCAVKEELADKICGMKIDKVQQPEKDIIILSLRGQGKNLKLLICAGNGSARLNITEARYENPITAPMFCMLLRKHISGAMILSISQPPMERLLDIELDTYDAMGMPMRKHLIIELLGRMSNIILTDDKGLIIDCMRRSGSAMAEGRSVLPGLFYRLPQKMEKKDITAFNDEELQNLLDTVPKDMSIYKLILDTFAGISPLVCREICFNAYGVTDMRVSEALNRDSGKKFAASLTDFRKLILSKSFEPWIVKEKDGNPYDFSFMKIQQYESAFDIEKQNSFSELLGTYYTDRDKAERIKQKSKNIVKTVKTMLERTVRKLENQKKELAEADGREELRRNADIIMANIYAIKKGMRSFEAMDFYSEDGNMKKIALDPKKNAQQNAAKYYKDYAKAKNAEKFLTELIKDGEKEVEYLSSVLESLSIIENEHDLNEIRQELSDGGYIKKQTSKKEKRIEQKPMQFVSSTGMDIFVGKNNTQNDFLTMKSASKRDMWLHSQRIHGSHVIIKSDGVGPDEQTIAEAARLAAYYSQGKNGGNVPIDYTYVKFVKKPSGAKPGMVIYTDYKTIIAKAEIDDIKRIK